MPTYQYACTSGTCGHRFEAVQAFSDPSLTMCPVCEGQLRKVFSSVGVVFKGSGFYRTDSRGKNGATDPAPKSEPKSDGSKSESTSESPSSSKSDTSSKSDSAKPDSGSKSGSAKSTAGAGSSTGGSSSKPVSSAASS